jgi:hypothetical protein
MRAIAAIAFAGAAALGACKSAPTPQAAADAAPPVASAPPAVASERPPRPPVAPLPCRAIGVDGQVRWIPGDQADAPAPTDAGVPLAVGHELPPHGLLSLGARSRLVVKDPRTSRETTFVGPAHGRACVADREESWLVDGHFESSIGAGEGPGAEEWVVTPEAVIRYTAAQLRVDATATRTVVAIGAGAAFVWIPDDARLRVLQVPAPDGGGAGDDAGAAEDDSDRPWRRVSAAAWEITVTGVAGAHAAVELCRQHAEEANRLARLLLSPGDASPSEAGARVAEQVRERRLSHGACALAALRVASAPSGASRGDVDAVARANELWATVPVAPR